MTYSPVIYDWRKSIPVSDQIFSAGGTSIGGGVTLGGALVEHPEPGGRAALSMTVGPFKNNHIMNRDASWSMTALKNGAVFRIRLCASPQ